MDESVHAANGIKVEEDLLSRLEREAETVAVCHHLKIAFCTCTGGADMDNRSSGSNPLFSGLALWHAHAKKCLSCKYTVTQSEFTS